MAEPDPVLGVCSWSLQPTDAADLAAKVTGTGLAHVQLALKPLEWWGRQVKRTVGVLAEAGIGVRSGMMSTVGEDYTDLDTIRRTGGLRPDVHWAANQKLAERTARCASALGLSLVTFHAGFLPHDPADPERTELIGRLQRVADIFADQGVRLGLETGQETAATLLAVLQAVDRPNVGVNFDPANMLLYDMGDPVEALTTLAPHVLQIHVKDAVRTRTPGTWGDEVPAGTGEVDWAAFFGVAADAGLDVDFMIEREAGEQRLDDIVTARELVRSHRDRVAT